MSKSAVPEPDPPPEYEPGRGPASPGRRMRSSGAEVARGVASAARGDSEATERMTLTDDSRCAVASLPSDAKEVQGEHWRTIRDINQRLGEAFEAEGTILLHAAKTVSERSTDAEKERLRAALARAEDALHAFEVYDIWYRSSQLGRVKPEFNESQVKMRRLMKLGRRRLRQLGDPTSPGWRRRWGSRLRMWIHSAGS